MSINYEIVTVDNVDCIKDLCNELMAYQKAKAYIHPDWFDNMCYETRMIPSIEGAKANHIIVAKDADKIIGYAYSNVSLKYTYSGGFATLEPVDFFDFDSVKGDDVGCLSQFFLKDGYRNMRIGTTLFEKSMDWLHAENSTNDIFIFVSNGNDNALKFYTGKGFRISHNILDDFITVLRNI